MRTPHPYGGYAPDEAQNDRNLGTSEEDEELACFVGFEGESAVPFEWTDAEGDHHTTHMIGHINIRKISNLTGASSIMFNRLTIDGQVISHTSDASNRHNYTPDIHRALSDHEIDDLIQLFE